MFVLILKKENQWMFGNFAKSKDGRRINLSDFTDAQRFSTKDEARNWAGSSITQFDIKRVPEIELEIKKSLANIVNNLPDDDDMVKVTGLTLQNFGTVEGALSAYEMGMNFLFQRGNAFARNCKLFSNLNLTEYVQ